MPTHRNPRRRKRSRTLVAGDPGRAPTFARQREDVLQPLHAAPGVLVKTGERSVTQRVPMTTNVNRGKRHLSTLGHVDPRTTNGRAQPVAEATRTRHRPIKPRAHKSVAWLAAELHRTSDAFRYSDAPKH